MTASPSAPSRLSNYAAEALELAKVLELLAPHAATAWGQLRVLRAVPYPRAEDAVLAIARAELLLRWIRSGESPPLGTTRDLEEPLRRARRGGAPFDSEELAALRDFLHTVVDLIAWFGEPHRETDEFRELIAALDPIEDLADALDRDLDEQGRVRDDASVHLSTVRREARELRREIEIRLTALMARPEVRRALQEDRVRFREGRPLLALKRERRSVVPGVVHDYSHTGQTAFVEPEVVLDLGDRLRRAHLEESREVSRILVAYTQRVFERQAAIERDLALVGEIELACAGARAVQKGFGALPRALDGGVLDLRGARHPLLEQRLREEGGGEELVPLDLHLGEEFDLLLITGPNTGGKTVALKTAGLSAALAASGLPVPANEGSRCPFYDGVWADIGDEQGIAQNLSTFSSHLTRIQAALRAAGPRTLVLLDELGAGTDPAEGTALGGALLEVLLERRIPTLASTHLGGLKAFAYRHPRAENASVEFDAASLRPLFRLVIGLPGESNALKIATRLGLDREVLRRAAHILSQSGSDDSLSEVIEEVRVARTEAEAARSRAKDLEDLRVRELEHAEGLSRAADERQQVLEAEADRVVEESFRAVHGLLRSFEARLGAFRPGERDQVVELFLAVEEAMRSTPLGERRESFLAGLKAGDWVYVPRLRQRCAVQKVDAKRRQVRTTVKGMVLSVDFEDLTWFETL